MKKCDNMTSKRTHSRTMCVWPSAFGGICVMLYLNTDRFTFFLCVCVCVCVCVGGRGDVSMYVHVCLYVCVLPCCTSRSALSGRTWCLAVSKATISPCCCSTLTPVGRRWYCRRAPTPVPAPTRSWSSSTAAAKLVTTAKTPVQQRWHTLLQIRSDYSVFIIRGQARLQL